MISKKIILVLGFLLSFSCYYAQTSFERGISFFENRSEKRIDLKVDSTKINTAIIFFHNELKTENDELAVQYLLQCYYFKAAFGVRAKQDQQINYHKGAILGEEAVKKYPKNAAILMWYIANFSKYGEMLGVVNSAKNGLADKVKLYTEKLLELNPEFNDGAAYKILGVINYKVPHIPLLISWPSKKVAEEYLKKALAVNPKSISNLYYYAEYLNDVNRVEEAKIILNKALELAPRNKNIVEDLYDISQAKKLLEKLEK